MNTVTEVVYVPVRLAKNEMTAIARLWRGGKAKFEVLKDAELAVKLKVEVPEKKQEAGCGRS
jgi:hypothetical protein